MADASSATWHLGGHAVRVSHLHTRFWPEDGVSKGDLLAYYRDLASVMLPYLAGRPITMRVFPEGIHGESFYQRDLPEHAPAWFRSIAYTARSHGGTIDLPLIDSAAGLVWLANEGTIEFHAWSSREPNLDEPDQAVFDLDPGEMTTFDDVLRAALLLRDALDRQGMHGYPKTSGRRGLHIHVPLAPGHDYPTVRTWVKEVAEHLEASHGGVMAVARGATHRGDRVTIDYAQNSIARTMAAPYTARAIEGAAVAAPLHWEEIEAGQVRPGDFTLRTMARRLEHAGDLFAPLRHGGQRLPT